MKGRKEISYHNTYYVVEGDLFTSSLDRYAISISLNFKLNSKSFFIALFMSISLLI